MLFRTYTGKIWDELKPNGASPHERKFNFGKGTIFVLSSLISTFKLPGNREPLK